LRPFKTSRKYLFKKMTGYKDIALVARYYLDIFGYPIASIPRICVQMCHVAHICVRKKHNQPLKQTGRANATVEHFRLTGVFPGSILFPSAPSGSLALRWKPEENS